ncbi:MAG: DNA primase [Myxococcales bacterium]|nr:DNA primase [Myxococcales bacterium]
MRIPEETIAEIRERADLVTIIGGYVRLKKSGSNFTGLCPFHNERSPSFNVNPARRMYKCFGCGAAGDVFRFVMQLEGRPFPEVARELAERTGVELPVLDQAEERAYQQRRAEGERLSAIMDDATGFFMDQVGAHPLGSMAREAIEARGVTTATATHFRLGYAPHGRSGLADHLHKRGHDMRAVEALGLVGRRRSGDGYYDRFRHRLMFPITNVHGRVIAFSGRELPPPPGAEPDDRPGAKYINSPEGPLYTKGEVLYGLFEGRVETRRKGWIIICEGNFDLVALHQAGFENAVAPMGTAFTDTHAKLIRRYAERAVLLFDGDAAGKKATRAVGELLLDQGVAAQVVTLPKGEDPDTFLRKPKGAEQLDERIKAAPALIQYLIDDAAAEGGGDPSRSAAAIGGLGPVLTKLSNPVEAQMWVEQVARRFGVADLEVVRRQLHQGVRASRQERRPRSEDTTGGAPPPRPRAPELPQIEADLMVALLDHPQLFVSEDATNFGELLTSPDLRAIFHASSAMFEAQASLDGPALLAELFGNPALTWLEDHLARQTMNESAARRMLGDGVRRLALRNIEAELPKVQRRILEARRTGDEALAAELTEELVALSRGAHKLKQQQSIKG